jgi:hypothetical protein
MQPRGAKEALRTLNNISVGNGKAYPLIMPFSMMGATASLLVSNDI